jgi:outer membrane protein insertion porin family
VSQNNKLVFLFLSVIVSSGSLFGQQQPKSEVYKILGINVEGQRSGEPSAIIANTGLKVGGEITIPGEQTKLAIQKLHNLRLFDDVQIFIENRVQDGVFLLIKVKENPRLERIEVSGNDELDEDDVLKKINLVKGQIITSQDLSTVVRLLKYQYDSDGYLNAQIVPKLIVVNDTTGRVALKIEITEGPKVKVDYIHFHGNIH